MLHQLREVFSDQVLKHGLVNQSTWEDSSKGSGSEVDITNTNGSRFERLPMILRLK